MKYRGKKITDANGGPKVQTQAVILRGAEYLVEHLKNRVPIKEKAVVKPLEFKNVNEALNALAVAFQLVQKDKRHRKARAA